MSVARFVTMAALIVLVTACQPVRPEAVVAAEATALAQEEAGPSAVAVEEATPTPEAEPTQTPAEEAAANKTVVTDFFAALNARDGAAAAKLVIDRRPLHSAAAAARREFLANTPVIEARTFPDFEYIPRVVIADEEKVALYLTFTGTQEGPFGNRAATGRPMAVDVMMFNRVEEGKIVESWAEWDNVAQLTQLGHLPPELSSPDPEAVPVYPTLGEGDPAANRAVVEHYFEALNQADFDGLAALLAPDVARYSQAEPGVHVRNADDLVLYEESIHTAFPDAQYDLVQVVAEGDLVAALVTLMGTNTGPLGDNVPATGAAVELPMGLIFRIEEGKVAELWSARDNLSLVGQLDMAMQE